MDLKAEGGPDLIRRLAADSDVLIENFRPGVMPKFGLGAGDLESINPRLVYCSVTGWGQRGPWAERRAYAPLAHAEVGTIELAARRRGRARPEADVNQHADVYAAFTATNAVLAALFQRSATGCGQHLDVCLGDAAVYANEWAATEMQPPVETFGPFDSWHHYTYRLGDGSYVALLGNPADLFERWVEILADTATLDSLRSDPRFASRDARAAHMSEVVAALDTITRRFEDVAAFERALDDPYALWAPVRSVEDLANTDWARDRQLFTQVSPSISVPTAAWQSDSAAIGVSTHVGKLGQDNDRVLSDWGLGRDEIDGLETRGVIRRPPTESR